MVQDPRRTRRQRPWGRIAATAILIVGAALVLIARWTWPRSSPQEETPAGATLEYPQLNCRYIKPGEPWVEEEGTIRTSLKARLVMSRANPRAWLALVVKDYKDRTPHAAEVREELLHVLGGYFAKENLEWEERASVPLAGHLAEQLIFRVEVDRITMSGECSILVYRGLAYWFLVWSPLADVELAQREFADLRSRFALLEKRKDWQEKQAVPRTFRGRMVPFALEDKDEHWQEWTPSTDYDRQAVLALVARERDESPDDRPWSGNVVATVLALVLKPGQQTIPGAAKAARDHLEAQQKTVYPETTIEPLSDKEWHLLDGKRGRMSRLRVKNGEKRQRFCVLAVMPGAEHVLVFQCECAWQDGRVWEPRFDQLLGTLHFE